VSAPFPKDAHIHPSQSSHAPALTLLSEDEPRPVAVARPRGRSPFVLVCDHASRDFPRSLGSLGLSEADSHTHIAWDIGALQVATLLSEQLDATLVWQNYSRLVIDCNRIPVAPDSIAMRSDGRQISGNENLDAAARVARYSEVFAPYHSEIHSVLERRKSNGQRSILVAVHSFTPTFGEVPRPWHIGLMFKRDQRLAAALLEQLRAENDLCVGDNQPYEIADDIDYTLPLHGAKRGIEYVGLEIRQDLIGAREGQEVWAARLARLLPVAAALLDA